MKTATLLLATAVALSFATPIDAEEFPLSVNDTVTAAKFTIGGAFEYGEMEDGHGPSNIVSIIPAVPEVTKTVTVTVTVGDVIIEADTKPLPESVPDPTIATATKAVTPAPVKRDASATGRPEVSAQIGSHSQWVGTISGDALYTTVSSALSKLCPPYANSQTVCNNDKVIVTGIPFVEKGEVNDQKYTGNLEIYVESSVYYDDTLLDRMIKAAANIFKGSTQNSKHCEQVQLRLCEYVKGETICPLENYKDTYCNAAEFAGIQAYAPQIKDNGPVGWLDAIIHFDLNPTPDKDGAGYNCEEALGFVQDLLALLAPQVKEDVYGFEALDGIQALCKPKPLSPNDSSVGVSGGAPGAGAIIDGGSYGNAMNSGNSADTSHSVDATKSTNSGNSTD